MNKEQSFNIFRAFAPTSDELPITGVKTPTGVTSGWTELSAPPAHVLVLVLVTDTDDQRSILLPAKPAKGD